MFPEHFEKSSNLLVLMIEVGWLKVAWWDVKSYIST